MSLTMLTRKDMVLNSDIFIQFWYLLVVSLNWKQHRPILLCHYELLSWINDELNKIEASLTSRYYFQRHVNIDRTPRLWSCLFANCLAQCSYHCENITINFSLTSLPYYYMHTFCISYRTSNQPKLNILQFKINTKVTNQHKLLLLNFPSASTRCLAHNLNQCLLSKFINVLSSFFTRHKVHQIADMQN